MVTVPKPALSGASQLGGIETNAGVQDFQSIRAVPVRQQRFQYASNAGFEKNAGAFATAAKFAPQLAADVGEIVKQVTANREDAYMITTSNQLQLDRQDREAAMQMPATDENGQPNKGSAVGMAADSTWFDTSMAGFQKKIDDMKATEEYQSLTPASRLAMDKFVGAQHRAFRASATGHMVEQATLAKTAALAASQDLSTNNIIAKPTPANRVNLEGAITSSFQNNGLGTEAQIAYTKAHFGTVARTTITNILEGDSATKVDDAKAALAVLNEATVNGKVVGMDADAFTDMTNAIKQGEQIGFVNAKGAEYAAKYPEDLPAIRAALDKDKDVTAEQSNAIFAEAAKRQQVLKSHTDAVAQQAYEDMVDDANAGKAISPSRITALPTALQDQLRTHQKAAEDRIANPHRTSDNKTVQDWRGEDQAVQARHTYATLTAKYREKMNDADWLRTIGEWQAAMTAQKGIAHTNATTARTVDKYNKAQVDRLDKMKSKEQKVSSAYFEKQLKTVADRYGLDPSKDSDKVRLGWITSSLRREHAEANAEVPLNNAGVDALITEGMQGVTTDVGTAWNTTFRRIELAASGLDTDGDDSATKVDPGELGALASIPPSDRFEYFNYFARNGFVADPKSPDANPTTKQFTQWHAKFEQDTLNPRSATNKIGITPKIQANLRKRLVAKGMRATPGDVMRWYRFAIVSGRRGAPAP